MRFWITKNSELSIREQVLRQVVLAILSEDLAPGHKLPSVRALARRHHIHANTVSAAYHDLLEQGWVELRRGSGLYVRPLHSSADGKVDLERLLAALLQTARSQGYEPEDVLHRLERLVRPRVYERILIVEPEPAMREILVAELSAYLSLPVIGLAQPDFQDAAQAHSTLVVALPTRAKTVRRTLPDGVFCMPLRVRSVPKALEGQSRPGPNVVISIVSRSPEIRFWARAMLIAVGLDPEALSEVDATKPDWRERIGTGTLAVTDVVTSAQLAERCETRIFRVIADSSLADLKEFCRP